jgi:hypothetical protein
MRSTDHEEEATRMPVFDAGEALAAVQRMTALERPV